MKPTYALAALLAGASLLLSSCIGGGYSSFAYSSYNEGYSASVAWTNASYDANGFPIFGYSYGRPVYGYTSAGAAVFTVAALTALCFVPHWGPAPWYRGHWHYPPHIHRVAAPPHFPHGHMPHMRPPGGLNAPIHRNPALALRPMAPPPAGKPAPRPLAPVHAAKPAPRPAAPAMHAPAPVRPLALNTPSGNRPGKATNHAAPVRPVHGDIAVINRPGRGAGHAPVRPIHGDIAVINRPGKAAGHAAPARPSGMNTPVVNRPGHGARPANHASMPGRAAMPAGPRHGGGHRR